MTMYTQCELTQPTADGGLLMDVAWIDAAKAKEGVRVTLKGEEGWWLVSKVGDKTITQAQLKELQDHGHRGFASTEA